MTAPMIYARPVAGGTRITCDCHRWAAQIREGDDPDAVVLSHVYGTCKVFRAYRERGGQP